MRKKELIKDEISKASFKSACYGISSFLLYVISIFLMVFALTLTDDLTGFAIVGIAAICCLFASKTALRLSEAYEAKADNLKQYRDNLL